MAKSICLQFLMLLIFAVNVRCSNVPLLSLSKSDLLQNRNKSEHKYFNFVELIDPSQDNSEFWRETEILSLIQKSVPFQEMCDRDSPTASSIVRFPSHRTVRTICKGKDDRQICPQCPHYNNFTECELFRDSCKERRVFPSEYRSYCDEKYGKWRTLFMPADYKQCRCCDDCVFYRELDQSCIADEYSFDTDEFLPVVSIDFRAGCNPYWGHPDQELKALRCDKVLRRCVPVTLPPLSNEPMGARRNYRYEPPSSDLECGMSCRGYSCPAGAVREQQCDTGAFLPDSGLCNCCGKCSHYRQLNQKCAEFKKTFVKVNNTEEIEVEEEFLEPGCDDGLVCRQGKCQDIHNVQAAVGRRSKRDEGLADPKEPCKEEMKKIKKKYGPDGAFHFDAPQCTPLWLYAPVQCRGFVCRCALEDGTYIEGIKVPRIEVPNMNCDCAREKCRSVTDIECDGYGNYKEAMFTPHVDKNEERPQENQFET